MDNGTLIQPSVKVSGGGLDGLMSEDEQIVQEVSVRFNLDQGAPNASFKLVGSPKGFAYAEKLQQAIGEKIKVEIGYPNSSGGLKCEYLFAGLTLSTGLNPSLGVECVAPIKGAFTDALISFTMEKEVSLKDYPDFVKKKLGQGGQNIKFQWKGEAEQKASQVKIKGNVIQSTPMKIIADAMRPHGIDVQVSDSAIDGTIIFSYSPAKEGESQQDPPQPVVGATQSESAKRKAFIIGPTLAENIQRKQQFISGAGSKRPGSSKNSPDVVRQQEGSKEVAQPQNAKQQAEVGEASNKEGTTGVANPPSSVTQIEGSPKIDEDMTKASAALAKIVVTELSFSCPMVPYIVGIKPRDFVCIPSLKGPGSYVEDYEVKEVRYQQSANGEVKVTISGHRPYTGGEPMIAASSLAGIKAICKQLRTPEAWAEFYWSGGTVGGIGSLTGLAFGSGLDLGGALGIPRFDGTALGQSAANADLSNVTRGFEFDSFL